MSENKAGIDVFLGRRGERKEFGGGKGYFLAREGLSLFYNGWQAEPKFSPRGFLWSVKELAQRKGWKRFGFEHINGERGLSLEDALGALEKVAEGLYEGEVGEMWKNLNDLNGDQLRAVIDLLDRYAFTELENLKQKGGENYYSGRMNLIREFRKGVSDWSIHLGRQRIEDIGNKEKKSMRKRVGEWWEVGDKIGKGIKKGLKDKWEVMKWEWTGFREYWSNTTEISRWWNEVEGLIKKEAIGTGEELSLSVSSVTEFMKGVSPAIEELVNRLPELRLKRGEREIVVGGESFGRILERLKEGRVVEMDVEGVSPEELLTRVLVERIGFKIAKKRFGGFMRRRFWGGIKIGRYDRVLRGMERRLMEGDWVRREVVGSTLARKVKVGRAARVLALMMVGGLGANEAYYVSRFGLLGGSVEAAVHAPFVANWMADRVLEAAGKGDDEELRRKVASTLVTGVDLYLGMRKGDLGATEEFSEFSEGLIQDEELAGILPALRGVVGKVSLLTPEEAIDLRNPDLGDWRLWRSLYLAFESGKLPEPDFSFPQDGVVWVFDDEASKRGSGKGDEEIVVRKLEIPQEYIKKLEGAVRDPENREIIPAGQFVNEVLDEYKREGGREEDLVVVSNGGNNGFNLEFNGSGFPELSPLSWRAKVLQTGNPLDSWYDFIPSDSPYKDRFSSREEFGNYFVGLWQWVLGNSSDESPLPESRLLGHLLALNEGNWTDAVFELSLFYKMVARCDIGKEDHKVIYLVDRDRDVYANQIFQLVRRMKFETFPPFVQEMIRLEDDIYGRVDGGRLLFDQRNIGAWLAGRHNGGGYLDLEQGRNVSFNPKDLDAAELAGIFYHGWGDEMMALSGFDPQWVVLGHDLSEGGEKLFGNFEDSDVKPWTLVARMGFAEEFVKEVEKRSQVVRDERDYKRRVFEERFTETMSSLRGRLLNYDSEVDDEMVSLEDVSYVLTTLVEKRGVYWDEEFVETKLKLMLDLFRDYYKESGDWLVKDEVLSRASLLVGWTFLSDEELLSSLGEDEREFLRAMIIVEVQNHYVGGFFSVRENLKKIDLVLAPRLVGEGVKVWTELGKRNCSLIEMGWDLDLLDVSKLRKEEKEEIIRMNDGWWDEEVDSQKFLDWLEIKVKESGVGREEMEDFVGELVGDDDLVGAAILRAVSGKIWGEDFEKLIDEVVVNVLKEKEDSEEDVLSSGMVDYIATLTIISENNWFDLLMKVAVEDKKFWQAEEFEFNLIEFIESIGDEVRELKYDEYVNRGIKEKLILAAEKLWTLKGEEGGYSDWELRLGKLDIRNYFHGNVRESQEWGWWVGTSNNNDKLLREMLLSLGQGKEFSSGLVFVDLWNKAFIWGEIDKERSVEIFDLMTKVGSKDIIIYFLETEIDAYLLGYRDLGSLVLEDRVKSELVGYLTANPEVLLLFLESLSVKGYDLNTDEIVRSFIESSGLAIERMNEKEWNDLLKLYNNGYNSRFYYVEDVLSLMLKWGLLNGNEERERELEKLLDH